jgi:hypothetical protein
VQFFRENEQQAQLMDRGNRAPRPDRGTA